MNTEKTWFVTGSSKGSGLEIVKAVLTSGDRVAAIVRSKSEEPASFLQNNSNPLVVLMDVTREMQDWQAVTSSTDYGTDHAAGYGIGH